MLGSFLRCPLMTRFLRGWEPVAGIDCYLTGLVNSATTGTDLDILPTRLIILTRLVQWFWH